jgi:hypothetical protein
MLLLILNLLFVHYALNARIAYCVSARITIGADAENQPKQIRRPPDFFVSADFQPADFFSAGPTFPAAAAKFGGRLAGQGMCVKLCNSRFCFRRIRPIDYINLTGRWLQYSINRVLHL